MQSGDRWEALQIVHREGQGLIDQAEASFRKARELKPDDPETRKNLGIIALLQGRLEEGWPDYEWRLNTMTMFGTLPPTARWNGESLDDRTILLVAEQGLGDTLQFIRYASVLKQRWRCKIIAVVQKPLVPLLRGLSRNKAASATSCVARLRFRNVSFSA